MVPIPIPKIEGRAILRLPMIFPSVYLLEALEIVVMVVNPPFARLKVNTDKSQVVPLKFAARSHDLLRCFSVNFNNNRISSSR